ncbi:MAG: thrombospondin type 3 repeat-containing protein [bacterium]
MKSYKKLIIFCATFFCLLGGYGLVLSAKAAETVIPSFRVLTTIVAEDISVPTVLEVPVDSTTLIHREFAVFERESGSFQAWYWFDSRKSKEVPISASTLVEGEIKDASTLVDGREESVVEFSLSTEEENMVEIILTANETVSASGVRFELSPFVSLPTKIEISVDDMEASKIALAKIAPKGSIVRFPKAQGKSWHIRLWYTQPLLIEEMSLVQEDPQSEGETGIRFLARPGNTYFIYGDPDSSITVETGEAGNLRTSEDVKRVATAAFVKNPDYIPSDSDGDGIADIFDNCVRSVNPKQEDIDENHRGDACDDFDKDGIINIKDNCPDHPNWTQKDTDGDGFGDECDKDESRLTEKLPWLPWAGMIGGAVIIGGLFIVTMRKSKEMSGFKK